MKLILIVLIFVPLLILAQDVKPSDTWQPFHYFLGGWDGTESGKAGYGKGSREYKFILNKQYLYFSNTSIFKPQEQNSKGEIHEDWTIFSYDRYRKTYIVRQFNSEGFVNRFVMDTLNSDSVTYIFNSESIENLPRGFRARLTYTLQNSNEFTEKLELAAPKATFKLYLQNYWSRRE